MALPLFFLMIETSAIPSSIYGPISVSFVSGKLRTCRYEKVAAVIAKWDN